MTNDYSNLGVCTEDFTLTGIYEGKEHRCRCQAKDDDWRQREWAGYDIAALLDLCHLCVRTPMKSGTRWSWYACDECKTVDNQIASAIVGEASPRNRILPLGRHSMMNGVSLRIGDAPNDGVRNRFVESLMEINGLWSRLHKWKDEEAQRLAEVCGFDNLESVSLERWMETNNATLGASVDAWCRFVGEDLPDISELDNLRHARYLYLDRRTA